MNDAIRRISAPFAVMFLLAALIIGGCSSNEVVAPDYEQQPSEPDSAAPKITVTTDNNSPMPTTVIVFELPQAGHVFLEVTNATGYHVKTLVDGEREAGAWEVTWDATNDTGDEVNPGIYMYHMTTSDYDVWTPAIFHEPHTD